VENVRDIDALLRRIAAGEEFRQLRREAPDRAVLMEAVSHVIASPAHRIVYSDGQRFDWWPHDRALLAGEVRRARVLDARPQDALRGYVESCFGADGSLVRMSFHRGDTSIHRVVADLPAGRFTATVEDVAGGARRHTNWGRVVRGWQRHGDVEVDVYFWTRLAGAVPAGHDGESFEAIVYARVAQRIVAACPYGHMLRAHPELPVWFFRYGSDGEVERIEDRHGNVLYSSTPPMPWRELLHRLGPELPSRVMQSLHAALVPGKPVAALIIHTASDVASWLMPSVYMLTDESREALRARGARVDELWDPLIHDDAFLVGEGEPIPTELLWQLRATKTSAARLREVREPLLAMAQALTTNGIPNTPITSDFAALVVEEGKRWDAHLAKCIPDERRTLMVEHGLLPTAGQRTRRRQLDK
jgi:hypothetical protein